MNKFVGPQVNGVAVEIRGGKPYITEDEDAHMMPNLHFREILTGLPWFSGLVTLAATKDGVYAPNIFLLTWEALHEQKPLQFIFWIQDMRFLGAPDKPFHERWDVAKTSACSAGRCVRPFMWSLATDKSSYEGARSKWLIAGAPGIVEQDPMAPYA